MPIFIFVVAVFLILLWKLITAIFRLANRLLHYLLLPHLWRPKSQFKRDVLNGVVPSEAVLAQLASCRGRGNLLPMRLRNHFGQDYSYEDAVAQIRTERQQKQEQHRIELRDKTERNSTAKQYKDLADSFATVVSIGTPAWIELERTARALHGNFSSRPFVQVVKQDLLQIMKALSVANGTVADGIGRVHQAVFARIDPEFKTTVKDCQSAISEWEHSPVKLPIAADYLRAFNSAPGNGLVPSVALAYLSFLDAVLPYFRGSTAVTVVKEHYANLLKPLASRSAFDSNAGRHTADGKCQKCLESYEILQVGSDADEEAVKKAYRIRAQIYHPDRFGAGNDAVRQTANNEMKRLNAARDHIIEHLACKV